MIIFAEDDSWAENFLDDLYLKEQEEMFFDDNLDEDEPWTDEDEAGLEEWEEDRRRKLAEANEY